MEEIILIDDAKLSLTQSEFFIRALVSTGIGFVIGFEREHASLKDSSGTMAGLRTFIFIVLLGFLSTFLSFVLHPMIMIAGLLGVIVLTAISYWTTAQRGDIGGTSELAIFLSYLLGAMTLMGYIEISLAVTVIMVVFLSLKVKLQDIIGQITQDELFAFIEFVVLALLVLPFLPDTTIGPYDVFNPRELGWVIVLTSGIGFAGYILMKFFSAEKGILITGIVGGLVSSTIVTWIFSKKSKETPAVSLQCAVAIILASTIMVVRVFIWIYIFNKEILEALWLPLLILFIAGVGIAFYFYRQQRHQENIKTKLPLGKPLKIDEAIFFGLLYTGILFLVSFAHERFGQEGTYISSAIAALTDIDAITISMSKLAGQSIDMLTAQNAILIATLSNTVVKIGITLSAGSSSLKKYIAIGFGVIFVSGVIGFIILNI